MLQKYEDTIKVVIYFLGLVYIACDIAVIVLEEELDLPNKVQMEWQTVQVLIRLPLLGAD